MKKTSISNPVKSLGYIKCYSSSSPRPVKSPSNSIRYNGKKVCSSSRRPKTILKSEKGPHFSRWLTIRFPKTLVTTEKRLTGRWFIAEDLSPSFLNTGTTNETFQLSGKKKALSDTYWRVQLVCMKVQAHSSLEPPLEYKWWF